MTICFSFKFIMPSSRSAVRALEAMSLSEFVQLLQWILFAIESDSFSDIYWHDKEASVFSVQGWSHPFLLKSLGEDSFLNQFALRLLKQKGKTFPSRTLRAIFKSFFNRGPGIFVQPLDDCEYQAMLPLDSPWRNKDMFVYTSALSSTGKNERFLVGPIVERRFRFAGQIVERLRPGCDFLADDEFLRTLHVSDDEGSSQMASELSESMDRLGLNTNKDTNKDKPSSPPPSPRGTKRKFSDLENISGKDYSSKFQKTGPTTTFTTPSLQNSNFHRIRSHSLSDLQDRSKVYYHQLSISFRQLQTPCKRVKMTIDGCKRLENKKLDAAFCESLDTLCGKLTSQMLD